MKRVWKPKVVIKGWEDKPIKIQKADDPFDDEDDKVKVGDMTVFDAMLVIAANFKVETLDDATKKKGLKKALKESQKTGRIELDSEVFKWLKTGAEKVCPVAWQENANEVYDILTEGYVKENEPTRAASESATKAKGKKRKDAPPAEESGHPEVEEE